MKTAPQHDGRLVSLGPAERQSPGVIRLEPTPEQELVQSLDYIAQLQTEVRVLRGAGSLRAAARAA